MPNNHIECPEPGLYENVPDSVYRSWPGVSASTLNTVKRSPAHARYQMLHPKESTDSQKLGTLIHAALLQPHVFASDFVIMPDFASGLCDDKGKPYASPRATNKYKALVAEFELANHGKKIVDADDYDICKLVAESIRGHASAGMFVESANMFEVSAVWEDPTTGLRCKGRLDAVSQDLNCVIDLKTTIDASRERFSRAIFDYGYHRQGAMYVAGAKACGLDVEHYVIIAVEKEPPYASAIYRLKDEELAFGREELDELLETYKKCKESGIWPGYSEDVEDIGLPEWARRKFMR